MRYVFSDYVLDTVQYELCRAGQRVPVEPRVFDLLSYLVQHPGRTVLTEELMSTLYPNEFAPVERLTNAVAHARKVLQDTGQTQRYIQTVRRRGYCFIAPVQEWHRQDSPAEVTGAADLPEHTAPPSLSFPDAVSSPLSPEPAAPAPFLIQETSSRPLATEYSLLEVERRQLTVLVCRLGSAADLAVTLDPEVLLEIAPDYQAMCAAVVQQFTGHIAQYQGDQLVVHFGYPQAHEDDARRAVHTGLAIVEGMAELNRSRNRTMGIPLAVRVGIHTGIVVVGTTGEDALAPRVLGDTPTIAAQVQDLAAPNTVVLSSTTLRLVEGYFTAQRVGVHRLGTLSRPLTVYQVLSEGTTHSPFKIPAMRRLTPLIGRAQEVALLRERWEQVREGLGQVVLLRGEAGIGKSRLVDTLQDHMVEEAYTRIEWRCSPYYQNTVFYPIAEYFRQLLRISRGELPSKTLTKVETFLASYGFVLENVVPLFAALLSFPLPEQYPLLTLTPQQQRQKTQEVILAWLLKETERQPVCLVMEDLHWADPSTLEFCSLLVHQAPTMRVLVLLVYRAEFHPPWATRSHLTSVVLGRLPRRQVEAMIHTITAGKALPAEVLEQLLDKTDGVPLFVEELSKVVLEFGLVEERAGHYELRDPLSLSAIPATLQESLLVRLDRLGQAKQVAQLGATIGREFAYEVMQAVTPMDEAMLQHGLLQLVEAELLYQQGFPPQARYFFKHALIQEAAYQSLVKTVRQFYHQRIAQLLAERFSESSALQPELLAHHYTEAGLSGQALPYWILAGQRATERSANVEAISHLEKGLSVLQTLPDEPARRQQELNLQTALALALRNIKGYAAPEVEKAYARARELCQQVGKTSQLFPVLWGLATFYQVRAELQTACEFGQQLLDLGQDQQAPDLVMEAHLVLGMPLFLRGELVSAHEHLEQCLALYNPQEHQAHALLYGQDPGVMSQAFGAQALWFLGYPARALERCQSALSLARARAHPYSLVVALAFAARVHQYCGEREAARELAAAMIALSREHDFAYYLAHGTILEGWALTMLGQEAEGLGQMSQGLIALRATGTALGRPGFLIALAEGYGRVAQREAGLAVLDEALALVEKHGVHCWEADVYRLKGEMLLAHEGASPQSNSQRGMNAETYFQQSIEVARRQQAKSLELRAAMSLSRLWQSQGRHTEAHWLLAEIYHWFREGFETADLKEARALLDHGGSEAPQHAAGGNEPEVHNAPGLRLEGCRHLGTRPH